MRRLFSFHLFLVLIGTFSFEAQAQKIISYDLGQAKCVTNVVPYMISGAQRYRSNPSRKAKRATAQLNTVLLFFKKEFRWYGPANKHGNIRLITNFSEQRKTGCISVNASYRTLGYNQGRLEHMMKVLVGNVRSSLDIADDLDVMGHEFGHGVYASHPVSRYNMYSRMMNEGIGDVIGITVRAWNESGQNLKNTRIRANSFTVGNNIGRIRKSLGFRGGALRNAADPASKGVFDHWGRLKSVPLSKFSSPHPGSGVMSLAYKLMVAGGTHPRRRNTIQVQGLGFDKSFRIMFYVFQKKLPFSTYPGFAMAARNAARNIYGYNSKEYLTTDRAFAAVGLPQSGKSYPSRQPQPQTQPKTKPRTYPKTNKPQIPTTTPKPVIVKQPTVPGGNPNQTPTKKPAPKGPQVSGPAIMGALMVLLLALMYIGSQLHRRRYEAVARGHAKPSIYEVGGRENSTFNAFQAEEVAQKTPPAKPVLRPKVQPQKTHVVPNGIACTVSVEGIIYKITLSDTPMTIGREGQGPAPFIRHIKEDQTISRQHFDLWYQAKDNQLYAICHSGNGLKLSSYVVGAGEKVKITFDGTISIIAGSTEFLVTKE